MESDNSWDNNNSLIIDNSLGTHPQSCPRAPDWFVAPLVLNSVDSCCLVMSVRWAFVWRRSLMRLQKHWMQHIVWVSSSIVRKHWYRHWEMKVSTHTHTHTHTRPFNGPFSGTTQVSQYQIGKTNLDITEARDSEWKWHQLGHMQVCILLQTDNTSTPPLSFLQAGCPSCHPTNSVKALKAEGMKMKVSSHR